MEQKSNEDNTLPAEVNDPNQMSVLDLVDMLEKGEVNPDVLSKDTLVGCVGVLLENGYSCLEIAKIVHKNERTVFRYSKEVRQRNGEIFGPEFQHATIHDAIKCLDRQSARLIKFSNAPLISFSERAKSIFAACQIMKYKIDFLIRLGYLREEWDSDSNFPIKDDDIHIPPPPPRPTDPIFDQLRETIKKYQ